MPTLIYIVSMKLQEPLSLPPSFFFFKSRLLSQSIRRFPVTKGWRWGPKPRAAPRRLLYVESIRDAPAQPTTPRTARRPADSVTVNLQNARARPQRPLARPLAPAPLLTAAAFPFYQRRPFSQPALRAVFVFGAKGAVIHDVFKN